MEGMFLNEKDSLQDVLNLEKSIVKMYSTALTEGSNKFFRTAVKDNFLSAGQDQYDVYLSMTKEGFYQPESADKSVIEQQKSKFIKIKPQLN